MHLEMHFEPAGIPQKGVGKILRKDIADFENDRVLVTEQNGSYYMPDDYRHGLIILLHSCHHAVGEGIGLRHLCDWAVFVNHFKKDDFAKIFRQKLQEVGLWRFAELLTAVSVKYLSMPRPSWLSDQDETLCDSLMSDILSGGNFGHKIKNRSREAMLLPNRGKASFKHSGLYNLVVGLNNGAKGRYKFIARHKVLQPFGFMIMGVRFLGLLIAGKRKPFNPKKLAQSAANRKNLYEPLQLFKKQ